MRHINERCEYIKNIERQKIIFNEEKTKLNEEKTKLNEEKNKLELEQNKLELKQNNFRTQMEIKELRNTVAKLLKKKMQNINITNNNKITNNKITNNNLMVNINSFGNESLSHITINDYKRLEK